VLEALSKKGIKERYIGTMEYIFFIILTYKKKS
jgi:hypothetical protein